MLQYVHNIYTPVSLSVGGVCVCECVCLYIIYINTINK